MERGRGREGEGQRRIVVVQTSVYVSMISQ